jgi:hypothetical protein
MIKYIDGIRALVPEAQLIYADDKILKWDDNRPQPTEAEIQALEAAEPLRLLRQQRNRLLAETDWRMVSDYPGSNQTEWQTYRQSLRDITTQSPSLNSDGNLTGITWPISPTD